MKRDGPMSLLSEVRDLQIVDSSGHNCGICDEIELKGGPGEDLVVAAIWVGPGAYRSRLPAWCFALVRWIGGTSKVRVAWNTVDHVTSRIFLSARAEELGLGRMERRLVRMFKKVPLS